MISGWLAEAVLISGFTYIVTAALLLFVYGLMRWRNLSLTSHHAAYFVGAFFILGAGSMRFELYESPMYITYLALFLIIQGTAVMTLGYYKEKQSNPSVF